MINTIEDLIKELDIIRNEQGNMFVRTQIQVGTVIDINLQMSQLFTPDNKPTDLKLLLILGYIKNIKN